MRQGAPWESFKIIQKIIQLVSYTSPKVILKTRADGKQWINEEQTDILQYHWIFIQVWGEYQIKSHL